MRCYHAEIQLSHGLTPRKQKQRLLDETLPNHLRLASGLHGPDLNNTTKNRPEFEPSGACCCHPRIGERDLLITCCFATESSHAELRSRQKPNEATRQPATGQHCLLTANSCIKRLRRLHRITQSALGRGSSALSSREVCCCMLWRCSEFSSPSGEARLNNASTEPVTVGLTSPAHEVAARPARRNTATADQTSGTRRRGTLTHR